MSPMSSPGTPIPRSARAVVVEVPRRERPPERVLASAIPRRHPAGEQLVPGGREAGPATPYDHVDDALVGDVFAEILPGHTDREVVAAVVVEVAGGERAAERVPALGRSRHRATLAEHLVARTRSGP
jgi:hypothetical protein